MQHATDSSKLSPLQCAVDPSYIRLLIVAGAEPTKDDLTVICRTLVGRDGNFLIPMLLKKPSLMEEIKNAELRAMCLDRKLIEKVEQQMKETEQEWQLLVWEFCHERVTELAMIFC